MWGARCGRTASRAHQGQEARCLRDAPHCPVRSRNRGARGGSAAAPQAIWGVSAPLWTEARSPATQHGGLGEAWHRRSGQQA